VALLVTARKRVRDRVQLELLASLIVVVRPFLEWVRLRLEHVVDLLVVIVFNIVVFLVVTLLFFLGL